MNYCTVADRGVERRRCRNMRLRLTWLSYGNRGRVQDTKGAPLQDRWRYFAANERTRARRPSPYEAWQLLDSNYRYEVVRRGAFFDAEKGGVMLGRFTELETAQRCIEERAAGRRKRETGGQRGETPRPPEPRIFFTSDSKRCSPGRRAAEHACEPRDRWRRRSWSGVASRGLMTNDPATRIVIRHRALAVGGRDCRCASPTSCRTRAIAPRLRLRWRAPARR